MLQKEGMMNKRSLSLLLCGLSLTASAFSSFDDSQIAAGLYKEDYQKNSPPVLESRDEDLRLISQANKATTNEETKTQELTEYSSRLQIGVDYTRVHLKPHGHTSFNGNLGGLQGIYEYRPEDYFYGAAKFAWKEGNTHGSSGKRSLLYIDAQERLGYTFGFNQPDSTLTLYSGFGYRHLGQKLKTKEEGGEEESSLRFRYNEIYIPVGFLTNFVVNSWFAVGVDFTWMPQVYPTVSIKPLKGNHWTITKRLANFFVEVPFDFTLTKDKRFHLIFKPFYERWQDGHSTAKTLPAPELGIPGGIPLGLPGNTYNFYGADLNFTYCF